VRRYYDWMILLLGIGVLGLAFAIWRAAPRSQMLGKSKDQATSPLPGRSKKAAPPGVPEGELAIKKFKIPDGLQVDLVAAEPDVLNPVAFCFDERGRIYVAETFRLQQAVELTTGGHPDWVDEDLANRTVDDRVAMLKRKLGEKVNNLTARHDRVRLLEAGAGDDRAVRSRVFADGFNNIPDGLGSGVLARGGQVWYTCIPDLWLLADTKGEGRADVRQSLHHGYGVHIGFPGHDLHGLRLGPDGKLYFSIGDRGLHIRTQGRVVSCPDTGAVLRCNLDGSELEVYAFGLRNPQDLAFDRYGNLFTCDNNADHGDLSRWVYVVPHGDSGWRTSYQFMTQPVLGGPWMAEKLWEPESAKQAAYLVPPVANIATGPAGLTYHPGVALLPERYQGHFFLADFRDGPDSGILCFANKPQGASFQLAGPEQFWWNVLATDVQFGPDGGLYLTDWVEWDDNRALQDKGRLYKLQDPSLANAVCK
jgi:quinoprotein glucose dehydrogenase